MTETITIDTLLKARFKMAQGADTPRFWMGAKRYAATAAIKEELLSSSHLSEAVVSFLLEMDKKLDMILAHIDKSGVYEDFPDDGYVTCLNGLGLILETSRHLEQGDFIEVIVTLEEIPTNIVSALGLVKETLPGKTVAIPDAQAFSIEFVDIREEEMETLIAFLFKEERRKIRTTKGLEKN